MLKIRRFKSFVSLFIVFLLLVSSFVLVADKNVFATTAPVTWSPTDKGSAVTLSNGNLTMASSTGATNGAVRATKGVSSGKWYWEIKGISGSNAYMIGIGNSSASLSGGDYTHTRLYYSAAKKYPGPIAYGSSYIINDVIGIALDMDAGTLEYYKNGISQGVAFTDVKSLGSTIYPYSNFGLSTAYSVTANFGATTFAYPIPSGYNPYDGEKALNIPTNLLATTGSGQVELSWTAVTGATSYNVKRATATGGPYTTILANVSSPNYTDTSTANGTEYYYVVTAVSASGESANSNEVTATPQASLPSSPTNLLATAGSGQIGLSWTAVNGATSYNVKRATATGGPYTTISTDVTSPNFTDTSAMNGTEYYYVVTAVSASGESAYSNEATATPTVNTSQEANLVIHLSDGTTKQYSLSMADVSIFINWYNSRSAGTAPPCYIFDNGSIAPYLSCKDYIIFDKIEYFEVNQY